MQIILLSGGSGTRLWPLSNVTRSKQFLRVLDVEGSDERESMIQRVMRQLLQSGIEAEITVATSSSQKDSVLAQLGDHVNIVTEPCRRDTFPAICLACEFLAKAVNCPKDEVVVVMPCDAYTENGYFDCIKQMAEAIEANMAELVVMGITPTYPSSKYGYILPNKKLSDKLVSVIEFKEKPDVATAKNLIAQGALWNGGVFAFRLSYLIAISEKYISATTFNDISNHFNDFPKISFDYEVAEKAANVGMVQYNGSWKDLGTWNTLTDELKNHEYGKVITDGTGNNTHIINELTIPLLCIGTNDLVVAASPDGIIVSEKSKSENVKEYAQKLNQRPMFEERRWGTYKVIDYVEFQDGFCALTKQLTLTPGCNISYQQHKYRDEVWTFIDGCGELVINGIRKKVSRGDTIIIRKGDWHGLKAISRLTFIEVQSGSNLIEEDIKRQDFKW